MIFWTGFIIDQLAFLVEYFELTHQLSLNHLAISSRTGQSHGSRAHFTVHLR